MIYRSCVARKNSQRVCSLYKGGKSLMAIAKLLGISHGRSIRKVLIENGIKIRIQTVNRDNLHKIDLDFFKNIDSGEKAYWLGYITADGYITKNGYRLRLVSKDKEIIEKFQKSLKSTHPISYHETYDKRTQKIYKSWYIQMNGKLLVEHLNKLGVFNKKSNNCEFPNIDEKFYSDYIRGLFDGDGSVFYKRISLGCSLIATEDILFFIQKFLCKKFGIFKSKLMIVKDNIKKLCIYKNKDIKIFLDYIYKNSKENIRLSRKYNLYYHHYYSKIRYILADLDGTLVITPRLHFNAFNLSLSQVDSKYCIPEHEFEIYNGLPTKEKLKLLTKKHGLPVILYEKISNLKQNITWDLINESVKPDIKIIKFFKKLKKEGYKIAICTNCIRKTTDLFIERLGIKNYIDLSLSNEDVSESKPNPEIFIKAMRHFNAHPKECLILEDSKIGELSAKLSNCNYIIVKNPSDLYDKRIWYCIKTKNFLNRQIKFLLNINNHFIKIEDALGYTIIKNMGTLKSIIDRDGRLLYKYLKENI